MSRAEAIADFRQKYFNPMLTEKIQEANQFFLENKAALSEAFIENFVQLCKYILDQQEQHKKSSRAVDSAIFIAYLTQ